MAHLLIKVIFKSLITGTSFSTNLYIVLWLQLGVFPEMMLSSFMISALSHLVPWSYEKLMKRFIAFQNPLFSRQI